MEKTTTYLSNLTPLRGIAALLTVIFHVDLFLGNGAGSLLHPQDSLLLTRMYLMVDFFFILSGFIMLHVYGQWFSDKVSGSKFKRFTIARFARVYPLHVATLLYMIIITAIFRSIGLPKNIIMEVENHPYSIVTNLLLLQSMNLHQWFSWVHASWSISTEWWMYMVFPFLVIPFSRLKSIGQAAVALVCFGGYVSIMFYFQSLVTLPKELSFIAPAADAPFAGSINVAFQYGFLRCLFGFVLGMMLYRGYQQSWGKAWLANGYTLAFATLGLFLCAHFAVADAFTVSFFPFILLSAAYGSPRIDKIFNTKLMQRLGDWSFSIYLVHQPLIITILSIVQYLNPADPNAAPGPPPVPGLLTSWVICIVFITLTLLISYLTYRFWEVPARVAINKRFNPKQVSIA